MTSRGWWRRNRWGLIALPPVLVAAILLNLSPVYDRYWKGEPRQPVRQDGRGWSSLAGARIRLADLAAATDLKGSDGKQFAPPAGTRVWRATIAFEAPDQKAVGGCELRLEDETGRVYGTNASELSRVRTPLASCQVPDGQAGPNYDTVVYFVTPTSARPVAVRVVLASQLPRYARLTGPGTG